MEQKSLMTKEQQMSHEIVSGKPDVSFASLRPRGARVAKRRVLCTYSPQLSSIVPQEKTKKTMYILSQKKQS